MEQVIEEGGVALSLVYAPVGGLILSPANTEEECIELFTKWIKETF
jgi:hypothetical protein